LLEFDNILCFVICSISKLVATTTMLYIFAVCVCIIQTFSIEINENAIAIGTDQCTAIAVSKGATSDGSTMTTHTADCFDCDWRINKVCFLFLRLFYWRNNILTRLCSVL